MENKKQYPEGIRVFQPHSKAPDFVKGQVVITVKDLISYCKNNQHLLHEYEGKKQLKLDMLEGKKGIYFSVNTYGLEEPEDLNNNDPF